MLIFDQNGPIIIGASEQRAGGRMMRRRILVPLGVLLFAGFCLSVTMVYRPFEPGPRYKGLPLSYWRKAFREYGQEQFRLTGRLEAWLGLRGEQDVPAVLSGDPAAVPVLLNLLG